MATTAGRCWGTSLFACVVTFILGCGGSTSATPATGTAAGDAATQGNYLPLAVGMSWTYNITNASGTTGQGAMTVQASENAPKAGGPALRVQTTLLDGETLAWEQTSGTSVVRYEEQQLSQTGNVIVDKQYMPPILVLDESAAHLVSGATWTESYMELQTPSSKGKATKEQAVWTVEAVNESVTVAAGTYTCIRVSRNHTTSKTPSSTTEWYAVGVGKVRETGAGQNNDQTLELASVSMP
jgi:hypothetical protein